MNPVDWLKKIVCTRECGWPDSIGRLAETPRETLSFSSAIKAHATVWQGLVLHARYHTLGCSLDGARRSAPGTSDDGRGLRMKVNGEFRAALSLLCRSIVL